MAAGISILKTLAARLTISSTRAIVIVSPNNPTGNFLKQSEWQRLNELAARHSIPLVVDEVFEEYPLTETPARASSIVPGSSALTFSLNGLSKLCGMPQVKLGWMVVTGPDELVKQALQRLELIADTYLSVGTPVQLALPALLRVGAIIRRQIQGRVECNLGALTDLLEHTPVHPLHLPAGLVRHFAPATNPPGRGLAAVAAYQTACDSLSPATISTRLWRAVLHRQPSD